MNKFYIILCICALFLCVTRAEAARVDTLQVRSDKMNRSIPVIVVVPDRVNSTIQVPVLYLLHGASDNFKAWLTIQPKIKEWADRDQIMVVCPNAENSWYWDSPLNPKSMFETFVSRELVDYIDCNYPTRANRNSRAIAGLSMGGHGALWLSIRHKDVFGAAGSTSGGVDFRAFPTSWEMSKQIGTLKENPERWYQHTVMSQLDKLKNEDLSLIIDCGSDDFFYPVNCKLHEELLKRGIYHDFTIRPGKHQRIYWRNSIKYQWIFFKEYFDGYRVQVNMPNHR